jgi:hypothetical protein
VGLFHFNDPGKLLNDATGNCSVARAGTTGQYTQKGRFFGGILLTPRHSTDETTPLIKLGKDLRSAGVFSIEVWVRFTGKGGSNLITSDMNLVTSARMFLRYVPGRNRFEFGVCDSKGVWQEVYSEPSKTAAAANTWYFVSASYDGAQVGLSVNGNAEFAPAHEMAEIADITLGSVGWANSVDNELNGTLDDLRISTVPRVPSSKSP